VTKNNQLLLRRTRNWSWTAKTPSNKEKSKISASF